MPATAGICVGYYRYSVHLNMKCTSGG